MNVNQIETNSQVKQMKQALPVTELDNGKPNEIKSKQVNSVAQNENNNENKLNYQETSDIVESLEGYMNALQTDISFSVDTKSEQVIVTIKNKETDEIIRQIPPEELISLQEKMKELTGMIFSEMV